MKFLADFFPVILFFVAYQLSDIYVATAVAIGASFAQVGYYWLRRRRVETMHLVTLGLLVVFGGMTLILRDPVFIKWKPTIVNWLFAVAFFGSHLVGKRRTLVERMMSQSISLPAPVWVRLNYLWVGFFLAMGLINLYVAYSYPEHIWVQFKLFGIMGLTVLFVIAQSFYMARHLPDEQPKGDSN